MVDNREGGRTVGKYLWQLGHRNIAFVSDEEMLPSHPRFQGMEEVLRERGASKKSTRFILLPWQKGPSDLDLMDNVLKELLAAEVPPTAIFFGNDLIALPGMQSLLAMGCRIPEDISVVSFDDAPGFASHTRPPLTCMRMPSQALAALAVQTFHEALTFAELPYRRLRVPAELIVRESGWPGVAERSGLARYYWLKRSRANAS